MKWLRSTNHLSYTFEGKVIPSYDKKPLQVSEDLYQKLQNNRVTASLLKNDAIIVLSKWKDDAVVNSDAERRLQAQQAQIAALQADLEKAKSATISDEVKQKVEQFDALKAEAQQTLEQKDKEIAELKAQLEKASKRSKKDTE